MRGKRYRIGIDVGLNSVGLAAVEVSDENSPVRLLNAQSVIHDGGVDPQKNKEAITRKNMSGVARRTRRMRRRKRERLHKLDMLLGKFGYPVIEPESLDKPFEEWHVRAELATRYSEDDELRRESISETYGKASRMAQSLSSGGLADQRQSIFEAIWRTEGKSEGVQR